MGIVYQGYNHFTDSKVAIKVVMLKSLKDNESGKRYRKIFFNEVCAAGMLKHLNIMEILDAGVDGSDCYIVMKLVVERNILKSFCQADNLLPVEQVIETVLKCSSAQVRKSA